MGGGQNLALFGALAFAETVVLYQKRSFLGRMFGETAFQTNQARIAFFLGRQNLRSSYSETNFFLFL